MKKTKFSVIVAFVALLSGCAASVHIEKDNSVDLKKYRTYMWVDTHDNESDKAARSTAGADISVRNAGNAALHKAGWSEVQDNADVLVSYDVLVQRSTQQKSDPVYSQPSSRAYYNPRTKRWSSIYYPSQFLGYQNYTVPVKEGTITISMVDADTDKLVWQGWTSEQLNYSKLTGDEISSSVQSIFGKFKP